MSVSERCRRHVEPRTDGVTTRPKISPGCGVSASARGSDDSKRPMAKTAVTYSERPDATPEAELDTLAAVFRFVLFDSHASKGGPHELTHDVAADWQKQKVQGKARKERT